MPVVSSQHTPSVPSSSSSSSVPSRIRGGARDNEGRLDRGPVFSCYGHTMERQIKQQYWKECRENAQKQIKQPEKRLYKCLDFVMTEDKVSRDSQQSAPVLELEPVRQNKHQRGYLKCPHKHSTQKDAAGCLKVKYRRLGDERKSKNLVSAPTPHQTTKCC